MSFDLESARKAGYTDAQIIDYLAAQRKFDLAGARAAKYSDEQILGYLAGQPAASTVAPAGSTPAPTQATAAAPTRAAGPEVPDWARKYPRLYGVAGAARETLGPLVEAGMSVGGALLGTAGAPGLGTMVGAGAGYMGGKSITNAADIALGNALAPAPQDVATEAARNFLVGGSLEAGGQIVAPFVGRAVAAGAGKIMDVGKAAKLRAAKIARDALQRDGVDINAARAALQSAPADLTVGQATADFYSPAWQALAARIAESRPGQMTGQGVRGMTESQRVQLTNELAALAGGPTQTAARGAREEATQTLKNQLIPQRDVELRAANIAGREKPRLDREATRMAEAAASKVEDVRRFTAAGERAAERAHSTTLVPGYPMVPGRYTYMGELEKKAEQVAAEAAEGSLRFGEASRFAKMASDSLEAHGLRPLTVDSVVSKLRGVAGNPKFAGNRDVEVVIDRLAKDLQKWSDEGGVIDAFALDSIRKNSVNGTIQSLYPAADVKTQKAAAAKILTDIRPIITQAIENAGGTGYRGYLEAYTKGMQAVEQKQLSAKAFELFQKQPQEFVDLVRGNNPEAVERIFGPGSYDIAAQMADDAYKVFSKAATVVEKSTSAATQADLGRRALEEIFQENTSKIRLPWGLTPQGAALNKTIAMAERRIGKKVMAELAQGMQSGRSAAELLGQLPAKERNKVLNALSNVSAQNRLLVGPAALAVTDQE